MLFEDEMKKIFLAGVGAVATSVEMGQEMVNKFVKKGELTVEQGKVLNEELKHNFKSTANNVKSDVAKGGIDLLNQVDKLSKEQIAKLKEKLADLEKSSEQQ